MRSCPPCHYSRAYLLSDGRRKCRQCGHRFRVVHSWALSRLPVKTKMRLLELFVLGIPVYRQRFRSLASAPASERFYRLIRACMAYTEGLREPFCGELECDETTFGGARHGKRGWGAAGKVIVFGIIKRNGQVKAMPVKKRGRAAVLQQIQAHTREGSLYYTDEWQAYATLKTRGDHVIIRKNKGRPVGRDHINGIEGFWSYAKHWLYMYRSVPTKYFHLYLAEVCYRFNHRDEDLLPLLLSLMKKVSRAELQSILVQFG